MDAFQKSLAALPRIESFGLTQFPDIFGGVTRGVVVGALAIYLTEHRPHVRKAFRTVFGGPIQYFTTPRTQLQREALHGEVTAQNERLRQRDIEILKWASDVRSGMEHIGVLHLNQEKQQYLLGLFGPWVELQNMTGYIRPAAR